MQKLTGVVPPMVTPFARHGSVDEDNLARLVHFLSEHVHGLFICGSYGNGPLMNVEEKKQVIDVVVRNMPVKIRGVCEAYPREPFIPLGDREVAAMREALVKSGFIE